MGATAIIQARMTSSRLPGKVLAPILGRPMLDHLLERLRRASRIDEIIVAATTRPEDDAIEAFCADASTPCFRGSETDVLERFHAAAVKHAPQAETFVRITADCPLLDPLIVDMMVACYEQADPAADYVWSGSPPRLPNGMSVEVFSRMSLDIAQAKAVTDYDREHVTPFLYDPKNAFKIATAPSAPIAPELRLSVDTEEDMAFARAVFGALYPRNKYFTLNDIIDYLASAPETMALNAHIKQKTGPHAAFNQATA